MSPDLFIPAAFAAACVLTWIVWTRRRPRITVRRRWEVLDGRRIVATHWNQDDAEAQARRLAAGEEAAP